MTLSGQLVPRGALHVCPFDVPVGRRLLRAAAAVQLQRRRARRRCSRSSSKPISPTSSRCAVSTREQRGTLHEPEVDDGELVLVYDGLDGVERRTRVHHVARRDADDRTASRFDVDVPAGRRKSSSSRSCAKGRPREDAVELCVRHRERARVQAASSRRRRPRSSTSNEIFNGWIDRSLADLRMMLTETEHGWFPYAGVPWFAAPFGRDSIITAYRDAVGRPVRSRGRAHVPRRDAGRPMSISSGRPSRARSSTSSATASSRRSARCRSACTTDRSTQRRCSSRWPASTSTTPTTSTFLESIWANIEAALAWIDDVRRHGRRRFRRVHGLGARTDPAGVEGLARLGVPRRRRRSPTPPIALCEVQGYVYWARRCGRDDRAGARRAATRDAARGAGDALREGVRGSVLARPISGRTRSRSTATSEPCAVRASNAGHCLLSGIATTIARRRSSRKR